MNNKENKNETQLELEALLEELKSRPKTTTPFLITRQEFETRQKMGLSLEGYGIFEEFLERNKKHAPTAYAAMKRHEYKQFVKQRWDLWERG